MSRFGQSVREKRLLLVSAVEAHQIIKKTLAQSLGETFINTAILYGGSVKPENAKELLSNEEISGALVGGASLNPNQFSEICNSALDL